jgi:hypothetical protein
MIVKKDNPLAPAQDKKTKLVPEAKSSIAPADNRDFSEIQKQYTAILQNDSIGSVDTLVYQAEDIGYYYGGFTGSERDREEAERLRAMYPQGFGYTDGSGYSLAMWLAGDSDWNVYVDGDKVWWTPTWTNYRFYNSYNFHTMKYGRFFAYDYSYRYFYPSWGVNVSWDPWYWDLHFGWSYHSPYYSGYYYPYGHYYGYYGYGHHHHHYAGHYDGHYGKNIYHGRRTATGSHVGTSTYTSNRSSNSNVTRRANARTNVNRTGTNRTSSNRTSNVATRRSANSSSAADVRRTRAASRYSSANRSAYSNRSNTTRRTYNGTNPNTRRSVSGTTTNSRTRYGTQTNRTRRSSSTYSNTTRSSSPSYNKTRNATRPTYNSTRGSRNSSFSNRSTTRSSYSKVRSNPRSSSRGSAYRSSSSRGINYPTYFGNHYLEYI